ENKFVYNENFNFKCKKYFVPFFKKKCNKLNIKTIKKLICFYIVPFEINYKNVENKLLSINFPIYEILQIKNNKTISYNIFNKSFIFKILPSLKNDIYNLYIYDHNLKKFIYYDTALVNDYNTSKYINNIFNLSNKINNNIDFIEMSDSEEDEDDENMIAQKQKISMMEKIIL
ncbi:hypothetical protein CL656_07285, partial [bacterium]|nr:hypothetical protein [bacterium]